MTIYYFFFFQAEDGIRDVAVTGVQTCALPISIQKAWSTALNFLTKGQRLKSTEIIADDLFQIGAGSALSQRLSKPVMELIESGQQFEVQGSAQVAEKMIGLGPGVTPSGDDILIGFLAGLWSMAGQHDKQ